MKRYKLIAVLLVVALLATILAACAVTEQPQLTVKVNGKDVKGLKNSGYTTTYYK